MPVSARSVCVPSEDVVAREIEGDVIIIPLVAGVGDAEDELYTLNKSGCAIWRMLDGRRTLADVATALAARFQATPDEIEADVLGLATELVARGILSVKA